MPCIKLSPCLKGCSGINKDKQQMYCWKNITLVNLMEKCLSRRGIIDLMSQIKVNNSVHQGIFNSIHYFPEIKDLKIEKNSNILIYIGPKETIYFINQIQSNVTKFLFNPNLFYYKEYILNIDRLIDLRENQHFLTYILYFLKPTACSAF